MRRGGADRALARAARAASAPRRPSRRPPPPRPLPARRAGGRHGARAAASPPAADAPRASPRRRAAPAAPGRLAKLFAIVALLVVPLGLGGFIANQAVYFIGTDDEGFVTMYRGLPYSLPAGIDLFSTNYVSGVPLSSLPAARRERLIDHTLRSHDDAADLMRELERGRVAS